MWKLFRSAIFIGVVFSALNGCTSKENGAPPSTKATASTMSRGSNLYNFINQEGQVILENKVEIGQVNGNDPSGYLDTTTNLTAIVAHIQGQTGPIAKGVDVHLTMGHGVDLYDAKEGDAYLDLDAARELSKALNSMLTATLPIQNSESGIAEMDYVSQDNLRVVYYHSEMGQADQYNTYVALGPVNPGTVTFTAPTAQYTGLEAVKNTS